MVDTTLFTTRDDSLPAADRLNEAGGVAYGLPPRHALAQYVATGCLSSVYYADARDQLDAVRRLVAGVDPGFVAKAALHGRQRAFMKDLPAYLAAELSVRGPELLERIFDRVIDNARMLRNFVQILRSGAVGRRSLGSRPKRLVRGWLAARSDEAVFRASIGQQPSLADIVRMVHPRPETDSRRALYAQLLGREVDEAMLPSLVREYHEFQRGERSEIPDLPFQLLTSSPLSASHWKEIARNATWQMTRMNLNTFARHGVFEDPELTRLIAVRLASPDEIRRARVFPYQLLVAWSQTASAVPTEVREALEAAVEVALENVPIIDGKVCVCPDVSGSMTSTSITGRRKGATSVVRPIDCAALFASAVLAKNPGASILPFDTRVHEFQPRRETILQRARRLATFGGGGTAVSEPLRRLNERKERVDLVILVSDNESWVDGSRRGASATLAEWTQLRARCPQAKLVAIDVQPYVTTQAPDRRDILNIGGFSDHVFSLVAEFAAGRLGSGHWVEEIERMVI